MGAEAEDIFRTFELGEADARKFELVLKKYDDYFKPKRGVGQNSFERSGGASMRSMCGIIPKSWDLRPQGNRKSFQAPARRGINEIIDARTDSGDETEPTYFIEVQTQEQSRAHESDGVARETMDEAGG
ncbi:hypothetical protein HAZT_HAZT011157 [Hyalella azteca]|uniref:Uncharacterized protein n=1 Tax=Hyalella azteca TaxID=294128 RepID=A0A6A0GR68_HYAAZ|nr:hypothetical protein HAZT_HAZT011157 [Hyalella azteca]